MSTRWRGRWRGLALAAGLALAPLLSTMAVTTAAVAVPAPRRVGVWLTNSPSPLYYESSRLEQAVAELAASGYNTLYPNVWSRGTTFHRSRWAPMEPTLRQSGAQHDPICTLTQAAHRRGLQVIPWFEYGLMEPADAEVVRQHPEWVLQKRDGSSTVLMHGKPMVWLNPAHPGVQQRLLGLIGEIVQRCKVDGIQLDDHFAWPVELGYDPFTRALYQQETGREPPDNHTDRAWMTWRRHKLTALLRQLRSTLRSNGLGSAYVSLSPGPFRFAYNVWLQDWEIWALGHLIDELVVQNYAYSVKASGWGIPVEIGILAGFGGRTTAMGPLSEKVRLAAERGHGVIYFYWEGLWGLHAGPEGSERRRSRFSQLHQGLQLLEAGEPVSEGR